MEERTSEKNELPRIRLLAKQSLSSRDGMDLKVACTVDNNSLTLFTHTHPRTHTHTAESSFALFSDLHTELRQSKLGPLRRD